jgi:nicotinamidase-related amidase
MADIYQPGTAFIIIDMLNDFVLPAAPLEVPKAKDIVPAIKKRLQDARHKMLPIIYACDSHNKDDVEFNKWPKHAIKGTKGAEIVEELKPEEGDYVIYKRKYSAFVGTDLNLILRELKIERLILTGVVTDICVLHTAADGYMLGYEIIIPEDSCIALSDEDQKWALSQAKRLYDAQVV